MPDEWTFSVAASTVHSSSVTISAAIQSVISSSKEASRTRHSGSPLIKKGLSTPAEPEFKKAADGIAIRSAGLAELLQEFSFAVLDENGEDIREVETLPENFILSDHMNFTEEEEELLKDLPRYSVGPRVLHADHTITVILNEFDRREIS